LLVAEDPLARSSLMERLSRLASVSVLGEAAPDDDLPLALAGTRASAVVADLGVSPGRSLGWLAGLAAQRVPVLGLVPDERAAQDAVAAGVRGVLYRDTDGPRLGAALLAVAAGLHVIDDGLSESVLPRRPSAATFEALTPREVEVLQLLAQGLANKEIGRRLAISDNTAKFHVNAILGKLGARGRTEAVVKAAQLGLVIL
jgi:DNA-binding NarL/FixJ family response regulator